MAITISRGSPNAKSWSGPGFNPEILILNDGIALRGTINYGKGESEIEFKINLDSFADLANVMTEADKNAAIKAFGTALSAGLE
jgi:hypothetical protein